MPFDIKLNQIMVPTLFSIPCVAQFEQVNLKFLRASPVFDGLAARKRKGQSYTLRSNDGGEPVVEVVALGTGRAVGSVEVQQLLLYPLPGRRDRRPSARSPRPHAAPAPAAATPASARGSNTGGTGGEGAEAVER